MEELNNHNYETRAYWGDQPEERYPRMIVTASPSMKRNYQKFGDLLSFDITYNLLKNVTSDNNYYRLGVFCVFDTNIRILMAGIAIISQ
jgi:hypothetical protein